MRPALLAALALAIGVALGAQIPKLGTWAEPMDAAALATSTGSGENAATRWERRLLSHVAHRQPVPCPAGGPVILVLGQSNAANYAGERFHSQHGALNWFEGRCYLASGPMLGADGVAGSVWPLVGDGLMAEKLAASVTFVVLAVGNTSAAQWADGQGLGALLDRRLAQLKSAGLPVTHALWQQGESDFDTDPAVYRQHLQQVLGRVRSSYPGVKLIVAQASICGEGERAQSASGLLAVQRELSAAGPGPNTDLINAFGDRYDDCHFSGPGERKLAAMWVRSIAGTLR